jgi:hypothetical protein
MKFSFLVTESMLFSAEIDEQPTKVGVFYFFEDVCAFLRTLWVRKVDNRPCPQNGHPPAAVLGGINFTSVVVEAEAM